MSDKRFYDDETYARLMGITLTVRTPSAITERRRFAYANLRGFELAPTDTGVMHDRPRADRGCDSLHRDVRVLDERQNPHYPNEADVLLLVERPFAPPRVNDDSRTLWWPMRGVSFTQRFRRDGQPVHRVPGTTRTV